MLIQHPSSTAQQCFLMLLPKIKVSQDCCLKVGQICFRYTRVPFKFANTMHQNYFYADRIQYFFKLRVCFMQYLISLQIPKQRHLKKNPQRKYDQVRLGQSLVRLDSGQVRSLVRLRLSQVRNRLGQGLVRLQFSQVRVRLGQVREVEMQVYQVLRMSA